ncbi:chromosomal replication initiator protein DnaA [Sphingomonas donggukensis]|uniref:Chromosomal replication initiator protein DnaA n=1 Tax=Sphingomonas donggukensis TaxID=2949093 RepID=A0ABY4TQD7_9SPHN|nr:chromosomal replication initiator protein DnaA [Sphingomonas donggukensis]URW74422.1 chromosomal replication initiator protein DnaA [Sphingomonas donggukensis]
MGKAWARVRQNLRHSAGQRLFDQWLKPAELIEGSDAESIRLGLPSAFAATWVKSHYSDRLFYEFRAILPGVRSVTVETISEARPVRKLVVETPIVREEPARAPARSTAPQFDARFTFDRFVVDASNRVAFNAAKALAEPGRPRFSPLYLHSGTGQGKTHLMHAIGHAFLDANPDATALYMPAERFMFEFVQALRARDTHAFKARLRGVDLLMIDDLQFIAGKDATQEEFFHTVNEFMGAGKRLVIAADRSPMTLDGVEPRLLSRLGSGLVADIKPPELELRRAILARKLDDTPDAAVPADVTDLLSTRITGSVRELEGALTRVVAYAQLTGETITLDFAVTTLGEVLRGAQRRVTIDEIQKAVSTHFDLKPIDLLSARRAVAVARPRQIAMYLAKRLTTRSLPEIGRKFGNRDHSTVIHAVRRIEELRGTDRDIDGAVNTLLRQLER